MSSQVIQPSGATTVTGGSRAAFCQRRAGALALLAMLHLALGCLAGCANAPTLHSDEPLRSDRLEVGPHDSWIAGSPMHDNAQRDAVAARRAGGMWRHHPETARVKVIAQDRPLPARRDHAAGEATGWKII